MRKDTQRKFCWHSPYDLRATERWLEAQAQKGLLLRRWDTPVVFDRVGEPRQVHYRLEPICPGHRSRRTSTARAAGRRSAPSAGSFGSGPAPCPTRRSSTRTR